MQYQMSTAPGVAPPPSTPAAAPKVIHGAPKPPQRGKFWVIVPLLAVVGAIVWWFWPRTESAAGRGTSGPPVVTVRTATVGGGSVIRTLRLTGSTGAERFASLLVPQLRGSRAESLREGKTFTSPGASYPITSNAGSTGGGNSSGSSAPASASAGASTGTSGTSSGTSNQVASTAENSSGGGSAALRSATSRVSRSNNTGSTSARTTAPATSGTTGSNTELGSTANQLQGTGFAGGGSSSSSGGSSRGGGTSEFMLVLQNVAKPGSLVKKGQTVAEFDRQFMMNRLEDYRSAYAQMEASFLKLQAEVAVQKRAHQQSVLSQKAALDKAKLDLKTIPVLSRIEAEKTRLAAEEAEAKYKQLLSEVKFVDAGYAAQIKTAELELKQAKLELDRAELNASRMLMQAPINGLVVMQTMFRSGEMAQIQNGDQLFAGMRFMQIVDPSSMVINASVNQVDAESIRVGAKANVHFDAFPGLSLPATVFAIGAMTRPGGMRGQYVKDIPVVLKMDKLDPRVIPDLTVSVDVELESEQATKVPLAAVFQEGQSGKPFVFVKNGDSWARREVELGLASHIEAAVRTGLRNGEVVATEYPPAQAGGGGPR